MRWNKYLTAFLLSLGGAGIAAAHGSDDDIVRVSYSPEEIRVEAMIDGDMLLDFDSDQDGVLSKSEFTAQQSLIATWVDQHVDCIDGQSRKADLVRSDLSVPHFAELAPEDDVSRIRIRRYYDPGAGTSSPMVRFDLWHSAETTRPYNAWIIDTLMTGELSKAAPVLVLER